MQLIDVILLFFWFVSACQSSKPEQNEWVHNEIDHLSNIFKRMEEYKSAGTQDKHLKEIELKNYYNNMLVNVKRRTMPDYDPSIECKNAIGFYQAIINSECLDGYRVKSRLFKRDESIKDTLSGLETQITLLSDIYDVLYGNVTEVLARAKASSSPSPSASPLQSQVVNLRKRGSEEDILDAIKALDDILDVLFGDTSTTTSRSSSTTSSTTTSRLTSSSTSSGFTTSTTFSSSTTSSTLTTTSTTTTQSTGTTSSTSSLSTTTQSTITTTTTASPSPTPVSAATRKELDEAALSELIPRIYMKPIILSDFKKICTNTCKSALILFQINVQNRCSEEKVISIWDKSARYEVSPREYIDKVNQYADNNRCPIETPTPAYATPATKTSSEPSPSSYSHPLQPVPWLFLVIAQLIGFHFIAL